MSNYYAGDDAVTLTALEADFLTGPLSSEMPWEPGDIGVAREPRAAKFGHMASPQPTPQGPPCCQG